MEHLIDTDFASKNQICTFLAFRKARKCTKNLFKGKQRKGNFSHKTYLAHFIIHVVI